MGYDHEAAIAHHVANDLRFVDATGAAQVRLGNLNLADAEVGLRLDVEERRQQLPLRTERLLHTLTRRTVPQSCFLPVHQQVTAAIGIQSSNHPTKCIHSGSTSRSRMLKSARPAETPIPVLSMARAQSLAEQAANAIVTGISAGALMPGQRIIETELASVLNMSRVPLREALKILEAQGIVESIPHRGTRIVMFDDLRVNQICAARIALERLALADAAPICKADPSVLTRLDQIIVAMERSAERLEWIDVSTADLDFHREICRLSRNSLVATLWETLARHVFIVFGHEIRDERDAKVMGPQHRRLRLLLASGDVPTLNAEIEDHILRLRQKR